MTILIGPIGMVKTITILIFILVLLSCKKNEPKYCYECTKTTKVYGHPPHTHSSSFTRCDITEKEAIDIEKSLNGCRYEFGDPLWCNSGACTKKK